MPAGGTLRVVFDTVVFVRALINPRGMWGRLVFEHHQDYHLFLSAPVTREILDVVGRPAIARKFRSLRGFDLTRVLQILEHADHVEVAHIPPVTRDPKDDKFLATARAAAAEYLVTEDQDLLVLEQHEGVRIVDAATFLAILNQGREAS